MDAEGDPFWLSILRERLKLGIVIFTVKSFPEPIKSFLKKVIYPLIPDKWRLSFKPFLSLELARVQ